jgi:aspartyl-tRNA synthetase
LDGKSILLMGWIDALRDHGQLLFAHLRDTSGIVQVVFDPRIDDSAYSLAGTIKQEDVVKVIGRVALRQWGTENPYLATGDVEVFAESLAVLSRAAPLPFKISEKAMVFGEDIKLNPDQVDEELRLQYRYLDLRRPSVSANLIKRYHMIKCMRDYLHTLRFVEVETPVLTKSTPEGARDYLVPSRIHHARFYALPQSPQMFKQILMMGGMDRYFQIARCFRDEDLRPNRQPEFTQLDMEASFIDESFYYEIIEELAVRLFEMGEIQLPRPFPRMTYDEAMNRYGTDRPDTRFELIFEDVTDIVKETRYAIFNRIVSQGGCVKGFCIRGRAAELSKNLLQNEYALRIVPSLGGKGMTWMKVAGGKLESNIVQFFGEKEQHGILDRFKGQEGDVVIMVGDPSQDEVHRVLGRLRLHMGERFGLIPQDRFSPLWVTDFPLFEMKQEGIGSQHHPFTMPDREDFNPEDLAEILALKSRAYDLVINGEEVGGGSIRIHRMETQKRVFKALGLSESEAEDKFGFFLKALQLGAPPHGGIALGIDRLVSMILKTRSIRDVIAFPKNRSAICPLTECPAPVDDIQLTELGLVPTSGDVMLMSVGPGPNAAGGRRTPFVRISEKEVRHVAELARLDLDQEEIGEFSRDLNSILDYVNTLSKLDTSEVAPTSHALGSTNVWREDEPRGEVETGPLLKNGPEREQDYFKVPKIMEG